jgi:hypothetical protein
MLDILKFLFNQLNFNYSINIVFKINKLINPITHSLWYLHGLYGVNGANAIEQTIVLTNIKIFSIVIVSENANYNQHQLN